MNSMDTHYIFLRTQKIKLIVCIGLPSNLRRRDTKQKSKSKEILYVWIIVK